VILTFIFVGLGLAAGLFMLTFLNAMLRELRKGHALGIRIKERQQNGLTRMTPGRSQRQDRAA
jgi:hypothetical protein